MTRSAFIKNLISLFGLSVIPAKWVKQYDKIYLLQCFVRGFQFYNGTNLLSQMVTGSMLELVREPSNEYDRCAIALHYNGSKIGFIPRESNEILSRLLDSGLVELHAEITHLEPSARTWENVYLGIYLLKETKEPLSDDKQYLIQLETPQYLTLKKSNNTISRIQIDLQKETHTVPASPAETMKSPDCFSLSQRVSNAGRALYRGGNTQKTELKTRLLNNSSDAICVINRKKNRLTSELENLLTKIDGEVLELDSFFGEEGYVVANMDQVIKYPDLVENLVEVMDHYGNKITEIITIKAAE